MGVAVGDYDNDGDPDLYVTASAAATCSATTAASSPTSTEEANARAADGWLTSAAFFDMENDGDLDLFVCNLHGTGSPEIDRRQAFQLAGAGPGLRPARPPSAGSFCVLLRNDGGKFTDVSEEAGIQVRTPDLKAPMAKSLGVAPVRRRRRRPGRPRRRQRHGAELPVPQPGQAASSRRSASRSGVAFDQAGSPRGAMGIDWGDFQNDGSLGLAIGNFANEMTALYVDRRRRRPCSSPTWPTSTASGRRRSRR